MAFSPVDASKNITNKYYRYLKTAFRIGEPYSNELDALLGDGTALAKGPFLDITDTFEKGKSICELIEEGLLPKSFSRIGMNQTRPLYLHQEKSLRKVAEEKHNLVVSTGTGSGKTESFLLPVLRHLTMEAEAGTLCPGVRTLLIYPMNALANDQNERLRSLLKDYPEITFGVYTGQTAHTYEKALANYKALNDGQVPITNELISREQMTATPPHILITNYAMLEYLMLRPRDSVFFDESKAHLWRFIVFDEAHVYNGSTGIEVSMLFRRLHAKLAGSNITYILTSATLGEKESDPEVAEFANKLCDAPFDAGDVIRAYRISPEPPKNTVTLPVGYYEETASVIYDYSDENAIAVKLGYENADAFKEALYEKVSSDNNYWKVRSLLVKPNTVASIAHEMGWYEKQISDFVTVASLAVKNGVKLLDARYHMFLRATDSAFVTLAPDNRIMLERRNFSFSDDGTPFKVFEAATCIYCGAVYLIGKIKGNKLEQQSGNDEAESRDVFLLGSNINDTDEDHLLEDEGVLPETYKLCPHCGFIAKEDGKIWCGHDKEDAVTVTKVVFSTERRILTKCLNCENVNTSGVIRLLFSGQEASTSVVGTALFEELPSHVFEYDNDAETEEDEFGDFFEEEPKAPRKKNIAKQFIAFSDSRQAAAFYASYLNISYNGILYKRLIGETLKALSDGEKLPVPVFADMLQTKFEASGINGTFDAENAFDTHDRRKEAWKAILSELVDNNGNTSMTRFGLIGFGVNLQGTPAKAPLNAEEYQELCDVFALSMMSDAAIDYRKCDSPINENDVSDFTHNGVEYSYTLSDSSGGKCKSFIPSKAGLSNKRVDYLRKIYKKKGEALSEDEASELLTKIWNGIFVRRNIAVNSQGTNAYRLDASKITVFQPKHWYMCNKCRKITCHNVENVCPAYHCDGELVEINPSSMFESNHYYRLYNDLEIRDLRIVEHTAQLNRESAYDYQKRFKQKEIDVLSCSTTFEMGVDVGDLETVFMRNMPPMPANYAQRAGRAGRSKDAAAYALTFCNKSSHDFSYFADPTRMIKGRIDPPKFSVENDRIAIRHLYASALSFFWKASPEYFCKVGEFMTKNEAGVNGVDAFKEYLASKPEDLKNYLIAFLPASLVSKYDVENFGWTDSLVGANGLFTETIATLDYELSLLNDLKEKLFKENERRRLVHILERIEAYKSENILTFLSRKNILPKYGFPVDTVEMEVEDKTHPIKFGLQLQRDLSMAISEYAPGSQIVANNRLITSRYIKKIPSIGWKMYSYISCPLCNTLNVKPYTEDNAEECKIEHCSQCGNVFHNTPGVFLIPAQGFAADPNTIKKPGLKKPERTYRGDISYVGCDAEKTEKTYNVGGAVIKLITSHNDEMAVLNTSRFYVCEQCGYADVFEKDFTRTIKHKHKTSSGYKCNCETLKNYSLGYRFLTDVVKITFENRDLSDIEKGLSVLYGLLRGICSYLNIEESDISGCLQSYPGPNGFNYSLIIFDNTPGGAGHVKRLDSETVLECVFNETLDMMKYCSCGGAEGDSSCYSCLRSYKNQKVHDKLKRRYVIDFLEEIL